MSGQERRRFVEAQEEAEEAHGFERQSEEGSIILSHDRPIKSAVGEHLEDARLASVPFVAGDAKAFAISNPEGTPSADRLVRGRFGPSQHKCMEEDRV